MILEIIKQTPWQEWLAVVFSLIQVILAYKNHPSTYLFGTAGIILSIYVLFHSKLYAEVSVNIYYLIMSIYGWFMWLSKKNNTETKVAWAGEKLHVISILIVVSSFVCIYYLLVHYTDTDVAFWDSVAAAFAYAGMFLMAKRKIENWIYLNISNAVAFVIQIHKELYVFATLTLVLFIVAIFGIFSWIKIHKQYTVNS